MADGVEKKTPLYNQICPLTEAESESLNNQKDTAVHIHLSGDGFNAHILLLGCGPCE